ncbi:MAG TPA: hypothetical protein VHN80_23790 [Kineosporiaceae bacterium]|nr:hypothetical protein [Kineosporiaceae bacterium]
MSEQTEQATAEVFIRQGARVVNATTLGRSCTPIVFEAGSANSASQIRAYGLSCDQADLLVRKISATHSFVYGPKAFSRFGFSYTTKVSGSDAPVADYDCGQPGGGRVRWHKV